MIIDEVFTVVRVLPLFKDRHEISCTQLIKYGFIIGESERLASRGTRGCNIIDEEHELM